MKFILIFLIFTSSFYGQVQGEKYTKSFKKIKTDFSKEFIENYNSIESLKNCKKIWKRISDENISLEKLPSEDLEKLKLCDEYGGNPWSMPFEGCSWYCGGIVNNINSSSTCQNLNVDEILVENIHDFDYGTTWISQDNDRLKVIEYIFDRESAEFTEVIIVTGNIKTDILWNEYSRAKTIKMFINDVYFTTLKLEDIKGEQIFKFEPIGIKIKKKFKMRNNSKEWKVKYQIIESYKGEKTNIAISEIYYEGKVH